MLAIGSAMSRLSFQSTRRNVRLYGHLERLGTAGVPIPEDVYSNPEVMTRQIEAGTAVLSSQGSFWGTFAQNRETQLAPCAAKGMG
jgi:hypothetical protein